MQVASEGCRILALAAHTGFYQQGCGWYIANTAHSTQERAALQKALGLERTVEDPITVTDVPSHTFPDR